MIKYIRQCKFAQKGPINKHKLKFATVPKSQFHQVHVYSTYLSQLSSKV